MSDDDRRSTGNQLIDGVGQDGLGRRIDAGRGFVQDDQAWIAQVGPGEGHQLGLAGRDAGSARADVGVNALG